MLTTLEATLKTFASGVALGLNFVAIVLIVIGAIEALVIFARVSFAPGATNTDKREAWLGFARWLVAGLTFQLAADIVETTVAPGWDDIGRVGAIAVIRTFLTYFLDRDIDSMRDLQHHIANKENDAGIQ